MAKPLVLYPPPTDPAAFNAYYRVAHLPLARKIPGVRKIEVSTGKIMTQGPAEYHFVALLSFDSMDALRTSLASPEGQAAAADIANFATGGATLVAFQEEEP